MNDDHWQQNEVVGGDIHIAGPVKGTGIAIGHGARVEINYYAVAKDLLRARLRHSFDGLLDRYKALFAGRHKTLQQIANFINDPAGGYLVITARAGFGKTALMAELVSVTPEAYAYHFFAPQYWEPSVEEDKFLRNVVDQMSQWNGHNKVIPSQLDDLAALYHELIGQERDTTQVLILDGLDEVTRWNLHTYLGRQLPERMHIILTIRDFDQDWRAEYQLPDNQIYDHIQLKGLSREEVAEVLQTAGGPAVEYADDQRILDQIVADAAYAPNKDLGADPFYVRLLAEDIAENRITADEIAGKFPGLEGYLDRWWKEIRQTAGDEPTKDLFGTLTVALGPLSQADFEGTNPSLVDEWAQDYFDEVIAKVRRYVNGNEESGYTLFHPRLRSYLRSKIRIETYQKRLLDYCSKWQDNRSPYVLTYYVEHLQAAGEIEELIDLILDENYRKTQIEVRRDVKATDYDLRLALKLALADDSQVKTLACIAAYRDMIRSQSMAKAIFEAIGQDPAQRNAHHFERALQLSTFYNEASGWSRILNLYLGWEAALSGRQEIVDRAIGQGQALPDGGLEELADAILVRLARTLVGESDQQAQAVLGTFGRSTDAGDLLGRYRPAPTITKVEAQPNLDRIDQTLDELKYMFTRGNVEAIHDARYMEVRAEESTVHVRDLRQSLHQLAGLPEGRERLARFAALMETNPYPRYRDIGLLEAGLSCLAVPHDESDWLRTRLRSILQVGLDWEGITFTFDLASTLVEAAKNRSLSPIIQGDLPLYLETAASQDDRWGTAVRGLSAEAAAKKQLGDPQQAVTRLEEAGRRAPGFAGYATLHMLSLANRWQEFHQVPFASGAMTNASHFVNRAMEQAHDVRDPDFRDERIALVKAYMHWADESLPEKEAFEPLVRQIADADARMAYIDHLSARLAGEINPNLADLKALVRLALLDGTTLDAVLGRLYGLYLSDFGFNVSDEDLAELLRYCQTSLTTGEPWALEPVLESGVYIRQKPA